MTHVCCSRDLEADTCHTGELDEGSLAVTSRLEFISLQRFAFISSDVESCKEYASCHVPRVHK